MRVGIAPGEPDLLAGHFAGGINHGRDRLRAPFIASSRLLGAGSNHTVEPQHSEGHHGCNRHDPSQQQGELPAVAFFLPACLLGLLRLVHIRTRGFGDGKSLDMPEPCLGKTMSTQQHPRPRCSGRHTGRGRVEGWAHRVMEGVATRQRRHPHRVARSQHRPRIPEHPAGIDTSRLPVLGAIGRVILRVGQDVHRRHGHSHGSLNSLDRACELQC